jgi:hypothetical protein
MSISLIVGEPHRTTHIVDRRLTLLRSGSLVDDNSNKALIVEGAGGVFTMAYTGVASIGPSDLRTDLWLVEALGTLDLITPEPERLFRRLADAATEALRATAADGSAFRLSIIAAGFLGDGRPFHAQLSNALDPEGEPVEEIAERLETRLFTTPLGKVFLRSDGHTATLAPVMERLAAQLAGGVFARMDNDELTGTLAETIRGTAEAAPDGPVGPTYLSVVVNANRRCEARRHDRKATSVLDYAHIVGPATRIVSPSVRSGSTASPEGHPAEKWPELAGNAGYDGRFIRVENCSPEPWRDVRVDINVPGTAEELQSIAAGSLYSKGYVYHFGGVAERQSERVGVEAFLCPAPPRTFNPTTDRVKSLLLTAKLPSGLFGKRFEVRGEGER